MKVDRQTIQLQQALSSAELLAVSSDAGLIKAVAEVLRSVTPQPPPVKAAAKPLTAKQAKAAAKKSKSKDGTPLVVDLTFTAPTPAPRPAAQPLTLGNLERAIKHVLDFAESEAKAADALVDKIQPLRPPEPEPAPVATKKGSKAKPAKVKAVVAQDPNADLRSHLQRLRSALQLAKLLVELVSEE